MSGGLICYCSVAKSCPTLQNPCPPPSLGICPSSCLLHQYSLIFCCCIVTQSYPTLCDPMACSSPGFLVLHHLPGLAQTHVHLLAKSPKGLRFTPTVFQGGGPPDEHCQQANRSSDVILCPRRGPPTPALGLECDGQSEVIVIDCGSYPHPARSVHR